MVMYRVQMILTTDDLNPANFVTNTWYCLGVDVSDAEDFKDTLVLGYQGISSTYLSSLLRPSGHIYKIYDMEDPEPRAPVSEGTWSTSTTAATTLPPEVALCLSFQASKMSGQVQARRRGRVYVGPLSTASNGTDGRPAAGLVTALSDFGDDILTASGSATWDWATHSSFSPTTGLPVVDGWVDNEFDTQRRRGREWTTRTVFPP